MKNILLRPLMIIIMLTACEGGNENKAFYDFPGQVWKRFENPVIELEIVKPGIFYDMWIELEYDPAIAPEGIPVTVISSTPSGEVRSRNIGLTLDKQQGKVRAILRKDFAFAETGTSSFEIENRSQGLETAGMKRIGVVLEKAK